jgi:GntR family transcriptional regulator
MELPLLVTENEGMPIYLQIFHQLRHLIISRRLPEGSQLPSVRQLSKQLGVNAGTVVQAYRELRTQGFVDAQQGRGNYVRRLSAPAEDFALRQALLDDALAKALERSRALGFDIATVRQHFNMFLATQGGPIPVLFLSINRPHAEKYAAVLSKHFAESGIEVLPYTLDDLERKKPDLLRAFERAYYAISFVTFVPRVQKALLDQGIPSTVLGITAEITQSTLEGLHDLPPYKRYAIVTEERNINSFLGYVRQHTAIDYKTVRLFLPGQTDLLKRALPDLDTVIYSFGVREAIEQCRVPKAKQLELEFNITMDSLRHLRKVLEPMMSAVPV